jgi:hypothetical protein
MSDNAPQTYANHHRFDPAYHYLLATILAVNLVWTIILGFRGFSFATGWQVVMALGFMILFLKARAYPLRAQDRLIRLEERLRMKALLPATLVTRASEQLKPSQYVALRFASDEELPGLVQQTLDEDLKSEDIKKRITSWRADLFRV